MSGVDQAETASRCAVDFPEEDWPERLTPQVSSPISETKSPANAATTPNVQWGHPATDKAASIALRQPPSSPAIATPGSSRVDAPSSRVRTCGAPLTSPFGAMKMGSARPGTSYQPDRR